MTAHVSQALDELRHAVSDVHLPLPLTGAERARRDAKSIADQLDDYVLPRLARLDAPLLAVVGGSTGAGKSTLVNSLVGRRVTTPGVIRPTTRSPVLVYNPADEAWFVGQRILPGLARTSGQTNDTHALQLVPEPTLPEGLAILDAPDIDSVVDENRALAAQLLGAADLWLFVTSAARYADAVPWDFLHQAAHRHVTVAVILDRVPPAGMRDIPSHLGQMMAERGLGDSPLFAVPETTVDEAGLLPNSAVSPIRSWMASLVASEASRHDVIRSTLSGAITNAAALAPGIAQAVDDQTEAVTQLRDDVNASYAEATRATSVQTADGTLLRGEVLARWHEFVGTGEFMRAVSDRISWFRDRVTAAFRAEPQEADDVKVAVESGMEALIIEEGQAAAERAEAAWRANDYGRHVLASHPGDLSRPSPDFPDQVQRVIREWQRSVFTMVRDEAGDRRMTARYLALGVNGIGVALMVVVFAQTGGLTGAEVGVAGGAAALAQKVLEAVFGDENVRRMARRAKEDLDQRIEVLMSAELLRYHQALVALQVRPAQAEEIRHAADRVQAAMAGGLDVDPLALGGEAAALEPPRQAGIESAASDRGAGDQPAAIGGTPPALEASGPAPAAEEMDTDQPAVVQDHAVVLDPLRNAEFGAPGAYAMPSPSLPVQQVPVEPGPVDPAPVEGTRSEPMPVDPAPGGRHQEFSPTRQPRAVDDGHGLLRPKAEWDRERAQSQSDPRDGDVVDAEVVPHPGEVEPGPWGGER